MMSIGSLFSGIGGLELGLERAGIGRTVWQVENDQFRRSVLAKHWPSIERHNDVRTVGINCLPAVDLICGGFPCQDLSRAAHGKNLGLLGPKSGLWKEFARIVGELRPGVVVVENVYSAYHRWLPTVRRDLHVLGYRTRALRIDARDVGAPHRRARVFVIANANKDSKPVMPIDEKVEIMPAIAGIDRHWRDAGAEVYRMDDGIPGPMDRVRALGDSVVPQCAQVIGNVIALEYYRNEDADRKTASYNFNQANSI